MTTSQLVDVGGFHLHVQSDGTGPDLLFGHSLTFDGDMWHAQRATLRNRYRVHAVDLRGQGKSEHPPGPYDLEAMADDLARLLDHLKIERVGYCGLSMGGMVGMRLALRHPGRVSALVLMNTSADPEDPAKKSMYLQWNEATRGKDPTTATIDMVMAVMFSEAFRSNSEAATPFRDKLNRPNHDGSYFTNRAVLERTSIVDQLSTLNIPTLVITSNGDVAVAPKHARTIAETIPAADLLEIADAGHMSAVEQPRVVGDALGAFFDQHVRPAAASATSEQPLPRNNQ